MNTSCDIVLDRVYGSIDSPVTLCPTCGAVVPAVCPVTGRKPLPGDIAPVRSHGDRVVVVPATEFFSADEDTDWDGFIAEIVGAAS